MRIVALAIAALIALSLLLGWAAEYLWFAALGYGSVFRALLLVRIGAFALPFLLLAAYIGLNLRTLLHNLRVHSGQGTLTQLLPSPAARVLLRWGTVLVATVVALGLASQWDTLLRFFWAQPYGQTDPLYGRDIGFYLFRLPLLELAQNTLAATTLLGSAALYLAYADAALLRLDWEHGLLGERHAQRHLVCNVTLFLSALAWGFYLDRFALLQSNDGAVFGAGYTDVHIARPALWVLVGLTAGLAAAVLSPHLLRRRYLAVSTLAGYLVVLFGCLVLAPWVVQSFRVEPNELELETPYLRHNIDLTREAYALDGIEERSYSALHHLTLADLESNRATVENIRLWDWGPLARTFRQLQQIRSYYQFNDVDVDRYHVDGRYRQVLLAARELATALPGKYQTWVNQRLQFTHGYGLAMSLAAEKTPQGTPVFVVKDLPPHSQPGLEVTEPAIYYGEAMPGYRIVNTSVKEFDYPKGDHNVYTRYQGRGGVLLDSYWKRLLFAWDEFDSSLLFTSYITPQSRIQLWRDVQQRVHRLAPFLRLDSDPYLVVDHGRLYWIQDAYTVASGFPYAEPYQHAFDYIRNSVKAVVDAYDGRVTFYVVDPRDPVLRVYRTLVPSLFRPLGAMPASLRAHLRYPEDLFEVQLAKYATYHMTVPQVFYNTEDVWSVPWEKYGGKQVRLKPYYVLMKLPGEQRLQFLLISPLTPKNRDNMIAWLAARSDFPGYGHLIAFKLPKERLILGPIQVEAMIDQDTVISQQLSLWDQRGSRVIRGNLLVIPIDRAFIYVEPVYLTAEGTDIPELKRVIVSDGEHLAMEPTLAQSLNAVFGGTAASAEQPASPAPARADSLTQARQALDAAQKALQQGDWDRFGRSMERLQKLLGRSPR